MISVGLMTQLQHATKPPQLFKPDTNLQQLMDLAANFSDNAITCDECSGFYKVTILIFFDLYLIKKDITKH